MPLKLERLKDKNEITIATNKIENIYSESEIFLQIQKIAEVSENFAYELEKKFDNIDFGRLDPVEVSGASSLNASIYICFRNYNKDDPWIRLKANCFKNNVGMFGWSYENMHYEDIRYFDKIDTNAPNILKEIVDFIMNYKDFLECKYNCKLVKCIRTTDMPVDIYENNSMTLYYICGSRFFFKDGELNKIYSKGKERSLRYCRWFLKERLSLLEEIAEKRGDKIC